MISILNWKKTLTEVLVVAIVWIGLGATVALKFTGFFDRKPDSFAYELTGKDAMNCGSVEIRSDRSLVDTCVRKYLASGDAFFAWYFAQGVDSRVARGIAVTQSQETFLLSYDGDPSGGSHIGARMHQYECVSRAVREGKLHCDAIFSPKGKEWGVFRILEPLVTTSKLPQNEVASPRTC